MSNFFAGNDKLLVIGKQVDKDTPADLEAVGIAFRVYEFSEDPVRAQGPLDETDASIQQSASHVTAITPGLSFGCYGRASELDFICEALLGANDDSATTAATDHTATPVQEQPYYTIADITPYAFQVWDGCKLTQATFQAQDEGQTELRITGLNWQTLGYDADQDPITPPAVVDELPFIYAEAEIKYNGVHPGNTSDFSFTVNRNAVRAQGDSGFRGLAIVAGKLQNDGTFTRYVADDTLLRAVKTGSKTGSVPTADIYSESFSILFDRPAAGLQFLIASQKIAYETHSVAIDPSNGNPYKESLGFRTQPEVDVADNITIITTNHKATPAG